MGIIKTCYEETPWCSRDLREMLLCRGSHFLGGVDEIIGRRKLAMQRGFIFRWSDAFERRHKFAFVGVLVRVVHDGV